jgi:hypothetical protein
MKWIFQLKLSTDFPLSECKTFQSLSIDLKVLQINTLPTVALPSRISNEKLFKEIYVRFVKISWRKPLSTKAGEGKKENPV